MIKNKTSEKKTIHLKNIIALQVIVMIYTFSSIFAKLASGQENVARFLLFTGLEFLTLAVYAVLWQQAIKRFELSIAYANRAMVLLWSMIWAIVIFHNTITLKNIIGVCLVIIGTLVINGGREAEHAA